MGYKRLFLWIVNIPVLVALDSLVLRIASRSYPDRAKDKSDTHDVVVFSFPIVIQEFSYAVCNWGVMLILAKYASLGDVGIFSAAAQWYTVALFLPNLLSNVVLSYLSSQNRHRIIYATLLKKMMILNVTCAIIPLVVILLSSGIIASFYGDDFSGLNSVLNILLIGTIFSSVSNVYQSDFIARNKNWILSIIRIFRDTLKLLFIWIVLSCNNFNAAYKLAIISTFVSLTYFMMLFSVKHLMREKCIY